MRLIRDYGKTPEALKGAVLALGNFDGVHRGHRALIEATKAIAEGIAAPSGVLTFEPHPRRRFQPDAPAFRLTPFRSKCRRLDELGVDLLAAVRFNRALFEKTAEQFVGDVLVAGLGVRHVVIGYDFVFGHKRSGSAATLFELGAKHDFDVTIVDPVTHEDDVCSSTIIRVNLQSGLARRAAELLGHWWEVEGKIRGGERRGRQLGFPTANLHLAGDALRPALGVYAVHFGLIDGAGTTWHPAVANIGYRPTFGGEGIVLEAHLFDFDEDIYGRHARVAFVEHLRGEAKFPGLDALKQQIAADSAEARRILAGGDYAIEHFQNGLKGARDGR